MPHDYHHHASSTADIEMLDLDGIVLADYWAGVHDLVEKHAPDEVRRVVDLGSGSGNGALSFARRFPSAEIVAVDTDETMLAHVAHRSEGRVRTEHVDLDQAFPQVGAVDVAWASLSLHHLEDPDRVLADLHAAMRPGGLVAVAEMTGPLWFLPSGTPAGEVEERVLGTMRGRLEHELPHLDSDWSARLATAGFTVEHEQTFTIDPPYTPDTNRYAWLWFDRLRGGLGEHLDHADRTALDRLLDGTGPEAIATRTDVHVRGARTVLLARR